MIPDTKPPPIFPRGNDFSTEHDENGGTFVSPSPQVNLSKKSQQKEYFTYIPSILQTPPPPSYSDIPGTVPVHQGVSLGPPPSYEETTDPNGDDLYTICDNCYNSSFS